MPKPAERASAKAAGETYYFTGKPCKKGHVARRLVCNGSCDVCRLENLRRHRSTELGKMTSRRCAREWHAKHGAEPVRRAEAGERARKWQKLNGKNPEVRLRATARVKKYLSTEKGRHRKNQYQIERRESDPLFKLQYLLRSRLSHALKGRAKPESAIALLGCPVEIAIAHIERQFQTGMTWENWGLGHDGRRCWHVDHIKPVSSFDVTDPVQAAIAFHYTNLQPLWALDNIRKGAKV